MKVSWHVTADEAFTEWVNSGKSGVRAVQWLMDYLSKQVQVVHEQGEPILVDRSLMDNAAIYYNQNEIRFDQTINSIKMIPKDQVVHIMDKTMTSTDLPEGFINE